MNNSQKILYLGSNAGTSLHRAHALRRLGHQVDILDPRRLLPAYSFVDALIWRCGGLFLEGIVCRNVMAHIRGSSFDVVYVDGGELVGPSLVKAIKAHNLTVINYNMDDPYGSRDLRRWRLYLKSVPDYDLVIVVRESNVREAEQVGAKRVVRVTMSADERAHAPREITEEDRRRWQSDVLFIGTWMPERGPFLAKLIDLGVPLAIYGNRWDKAPEWPSLRSAWRGPGLANEDDYSKALQCAKVCLGLLSKGNRDESTVRSFEIPMLGAALCAERTPEHEALYRDGEEAVFWSTPEECLVQCSRLLMDDEMRTNLSKRGQKRCLENGSVNEAILSKVLEMAFISIAAHKKAEVQLSHA